MRATSAYRRSFHQERKWFTSRILYSKWKRRLTKIRSRLSLLDDRTSTFNLCSRVRVDVANQDDVSVSWKGYRPSRAGDHGRKISKRARPAERLWHGLQAFWLNISDFIKFICCLFLRKAELNYEGWRSTQNCMKKTRGEEHMKLRKMKNWWRRIKHFCENYFRIFLCEGLRHVCTREGSGKSNGKREVEKK